MRAELSGTYSTNGRKFVVQVTVAVNEVINDTQQLPASTKDILPEHRREIIAVMRTLAERIHKEGQQ